MSGCDATLQPGFSGKARTRVRVEGGGLFDEAVEFGDFFEGVLDRLLRFVLIFIVCTYSNVFWRMPKRCSFDLDAIVPSGFDRCALKFLNFLFNVVPLSGEMMAMIKYFVPVPKPRSPVSSMNMCRIRCGGHYNLVAHYTSRKLAIIGVSAGGPDGSKHG